MPERMGGACPQTRQRSAGLCNTGSNGLDSRDGATGVNVNACLTKLCRGLIPRAGY